MGIKYPSAPTFAMISLRVLIKCDKCWFVLNLFCYRQCRGSPVRGDETEFITFIKKWLLQENWLLRNCTDPFHPQLLCERFYTDKNTWHNTKKNNSSLTLYGSRHVSSAKDVKTGCRFVKTAFGKKEICKSARTLYLHSDAFYLSWESYKMYLENKVHICWKLFSCYVHSSVKCVFELNGCQRIN